MKKLTASLLVFLGLLTFIYLMAAFVNLSLNPAAWGEPSRMMVAVFGGIVSISIARAYYETN